MSLILQKSRFTQCLIQTNALDKFGFREWVFFPGMLFHSMDKWWGNQGKRLKPHEGLDLCMYQTHQNQTLFLDEQTKLPSMYDGLILKIMDDFIGKSVILEHRLNKNDPSRFCTIYGHILPLSGLYEDKAVMEGEILGTLAPPRNLQRNLPPHLHLSVVWISSNISIQPLDWDSMGKLKGLKWIDPLSLI